MTFLALRACLSVVLAHVLIVGSAETNDRLFALVANINTYEHSSFRDFGSEVQSPEVTTKFGINLTKNVDVNTVIVLLDSL